MHGVTIIAKARAATKFESTSPCICFFSLGSINSNTDSNTSAQVTSFGLSSMRYRVTTYGKGRSWEELSVPTDAF